MDSCKHNWLVIEDSRSINEYSGLENGWQRCKNCHEVAHFTRDPNPKSYPYLLTSPETDDV